jgi:hypothetical protein
MTDYTKKTGFGAFFGAAGAALQWRLMVLWVLGLLLPTVIVALPLWSTLGDLLDYSVHADAWASQFNGLMFGDTMASLMRNGAWHKGAAIVSLVTALLLSPFLTGMTVSSGRSRRTLGFGHLLQGGVVEYGRMFRVLLWALLPFLIVLAVAHVALGAAGKHEDTAVLESGADMGIHLAFALIGIFFVLAHAIVESARAQFIADVSLRSATRALGRGVRQLLRRPFATLAMYLGISLIGYALTLALTLLRIRTTAAGTVGFLVALGLVQLGVIVVAWMRTARLYALADVAASIGGPRRRRSDFSQG